jgi:hypothetical protein
MSHSAQHQISTHLEHRAFFWRARCLQPDKKVPRGHEVIMPREPREASLQRDSCSGDLYKRFDISELSEGILKNSFDAIAKKYQ